MCDKTCTKCLKSKQNNEFNIDKQKKDGLTSHCKLCVNAKNKKYYINNKEKIDYNCNLYTINLGKEKIKEYHKKYYKKNKTKIKQKVSDYRLDNLDTIKIKKTKYYTDKRKSDFIFKLKTNVRSIVYKAFKRMSYSKKSRTYEILGCSYEQFKQHLESKFESWMNWDNYGKYNGELNYGWDLDHIIPISSAKTEDDIIRLNHYTNLQPLCSYTNRKIKRNFI